MLGLYLQAPSLAGGFRGDDYVQRAMFRGQFPGARSELDLFAFAAGTPDDHRRLVDFGYVPWWSHPELRLRMWRPLASEMIALDYRLFGTRAEWHHVHSLVWFCLLLYAAGRVLWRILPPSAATLSLLLFASAPCHTLPVGWLANRSTLVGSTLAFLALAELLSAREITGRWRSLRIALVTSLALACGEYSLAALAYALAYLASTYQGAWRSQLRAAAPVLLPTCIYLGLHSLVGSDIVHSGYYLSPLRAPGDFARAALSRLPVLVADLFFGLPSLQYNNGSPWRDQLLAAQIIPPELWLRLPGWTTWHAAIGYLAIGVGILWWRMLRQVPEMRRVPGWLVLGAGLSILPSAGTLPEDRLLVAATLGASALIACVLMQGIGVLMDTRSLQARVACAALWLLALWVPISACVRSHDDVRAITLGSEVARAFALDADLPERDAASTRVYVLAAADFNTAVNLPWLRLVEGPHPLPLSYRRLSPGPMPLELTRPSERVLELNVITSDVRGSAVPSLYRDAGSPVRKGELRQLPGLSVEVLDVLDDNPARMRFSFDRSIDDPGLWFVIASDHGLRHSKLPAVGETVRLPYAQYVDVRTVRHAAH
jgi:hypothetical protein